MPRSPSTPSPRSAPADTTSAPNTTQDRYRDAFYKPMISDWRNYETWDEAGRPTSLDHAERRVHELLSTYEKPAMDDAVRAELDDFVDRRIAEGGVETDF